MDRSVAITPIARRDLLKGAGIAAAGLAGGTDLLLPEAARAQTPKRGGTFRLALQISTPSRASIRTRASRSSR